MSFNKENLHVGDLVAVKFIGNGIPREYVVDQIHPAGSFGKDPKDGEVILAKMLGGSREANGIDLDWRGVESVTRPAPLKYDQKLVVDAVDELISRVRAVDYWRAELDKRDKLNPLRSSVVNQVAKAEEKLRLARENVLGMIPQNRV